jgi:broad specificity phosphatase PhoE
MRQLSDKEMELVALISKECTTPGDVTARLKNLFAGVLEKMLEAEMDEHLGYEKNSVANGAKPRFPFPETAMVRSNRKQLRSGKPVLTKWRNGFWLCTLKE